jgi:hypothetical protein
MCNHLNLKILIHIFTIIFLISIIIIMRGENFVAHLYGLGGTPVCSKTPVAHHWLRNITLSQLIITYKLYVVANRRVFLDTWFLISHVLRTTDHFWTSMNYMFTDTHQPPPSCANSFIVLSANNVLTTLPTIFIFLSFYLLKTTS